MCDVSRERQLFMEKQQLVLGFVVLSGPVDDPEDIVGNTECCGELVDSSQQYASDEPEISHLGDVGDRGKPQRLYRHHGTRWVPHECSQRPLRADEPAGLRSFVES